MPRAYKGVRFQTGRGRTETGRKGARQSKSGRETKPTVYEAQFEADGKKSEIQIGSDGKVLGRE